MPRVLQADPATRVHFVAMSGIRDWLIAIRNQDSLGGAVSALLIVLLIAPLVGFALIVASHLVPDGAIRQQLADSIARNQLTTANYGQAVSGKQIDYFTDCIGISIGLPDEGNASPIRSAVATPTGGGCSVLVPSIVGVEGGDEWVGGYDYYRYWHGYTSVTRPSIASFGLGGARVLALVGLAGLVVGLGRSLTRAHGWATGVALLGPLVLTTDFIELPRSLPHATGAAAALAGAWYAHRRTLLRPALGEIAWCGAIAGAVFVYFDLLTMPPGAAVLLVGVIGFAFAQVATGRRLGVGMFLALVAWSAGWVWMWVTKWLIASIVFGVGTVYDVIRFTAENRLDGSAESFDFSFLNTSWTMLVTWKNQPLTPTVMVVFTAAVGVVVALRRRAGSFDRIADRLVLAVPSVIVFVWFEIMRNHSQNHGFFTYRSLAVSAGLVLAAAVVVLPTIIDPEVEDRDVTRDDGADV